MNWLKKGPEIKLSSLRLSALRLPGLRLPGRSTPKAPAQPQAKASRPQLKIPDLLVDLYYDLKERHLLPVAIVLAISIVVVPLALTHAQGSSSASEEEAAFATPSVVAPEASTLTVASAAPGLRDYRRRLRHAHALDPFRESSAKAEAAGSSGEGEVTPTAEAVESTGTPAEVPPAEYFAPPVSGQAESEGSESPGTTGTNTDAKFATKTLDVRIVTVPQQSEDARSSAKPSAEVRRNLPELTMLPSRQAPAAVFMGTSSDGKKALLLVSSDVQSLFGDGQCIVGSQTCQLLALEAGVPETLVYGPQARTYRIEILKVNNELTSKPRRAPLGRPKTGKGQETEQGSEEGAAAPAPEAAGRVSTAQPR